MASTQFGSELKGALRQIPVSREELSSRTQLSETTLWRLETGRQQPLLNTLCSIAAATNRTIVVTRDGAWFSPHQASARPRLAAEAALLAEYKEMLHDVITDMCSFVDALTGGDECTETMSVPDAAGNGSRSTSTQPSGATAAADVLLGEF